MLLFILVIMSFKETLEKIEGSKIYKDFMAQNPKAELCAGFFILDFIGNDNKFSLDYKLGDKIFTFNLNFDNITIQEDKLMDIPPKENNQFPQIFEKINLPNIELKELKTYAELKAIDNKIKSKFQKIIAILQTYRGPENKNKKLQVWNLTCILDGLIILHIIINSKTGKVIKFEKKSLVDMFNMGKK